MRGMWWASKIKDQECVADFKIYILLSNDLFTSSKFTLHLTAAKFICVDSTKRYNNIFLTLSFIIKKMWYLQKESSTRKMLMNIHYKINIKVSFFSSLFGLKRCKILLDFGYFCVLNFAFKNDVEPEHCQLVIFHA